ncbi:hypothetical protein DUD43_09085 [Alcaligenes faecalis]|uniref:hypothetical protein n=1 Tax=Alcaligenes faecalis TaxID=511 RepID=UPI0012A95837|nr:hypothetical protein [Alcaligenes faecalis]QFY77824.1 hypothetical protein DUD43_09085 [Alcaligenes faecalis]
MGVKVVFLVGLFSMALAGCGNDDTEPVATAGKVWNESEVVEAVGIKVRENGIGKYFVTAEGVECDAPTIMKTAQAVQMYKKSGDTVATNLAGTAGVKIVAHEQRACLEDANRLLEKLR